MTHGNHKPDVVDLPADDEQDPDESYLVYVPRVQSMIKDHGLLYVPIPIVERQAALGIPNDDGESQLGHAETLTDMTAELLEGLGKFSSARRVQSDTRELLLTAAELHDIGKTGPPIDVNPNPIPFVKFYNINFPVGTQKIKFRTALAMAVKIGGITHEEKQYIERTLKQYGIDSDRMYLRTFYNLHSLFTYDILRQGGVREDISAVASGHHLKRGVKPDSYSFGDLAETGKYLEPLDELAAMVRGNNERTRSLSTRDRIQAVYVPFEALPRPVSSLYCDLMNVAVASGVLQKVVENHPRQKP